ncbi:MAG: LppX_LprAFG lipoprotein [Nocardioidaceae bacterium]
MTTRRLPLVGALLVPVVLALTACGGDKASDADPAEALAAAKTAWDKTPGVEFSLTTPELPKGISGVTKAVGTGTHQPGFEGKIELLYSGISANVAVKAVDGKVWAVLPFTSKYARIDPSEYNAPDPAVLMDPDEGLSSWLTAATGVKKGDKTRDGRDVLTTYTGTVPGDVVAGSIPSADKSASFDAVFSIDADGKLRVASLKGPFYAGKTPLTYDVTISEYDVDKTVAAP